MAATSALEAEGRKPVRVRVPPPAPTQWFVYLLRCNDGSLYCGMTNDLDKRVEKHNSGKGAKYTRSRKPVVLVWSAEHPTKSAAMRQEADIKKLKKKQKENIVAG